MRSSLPLALAAAVAVVIATAVSLVIAHAWCDATVPEGRSLWRGRLSCDDRPDADATLAVVRSGDALTATFITASSSTAGVLALRRTVDVTGRLGLAPDRWLVRAPDQQALWV